MSNEGALANLDVDAALTEIASGVLSKEIAARYGVTPRGLRWALAKHPDYKQAVAEQAHSIVEDAMHEMMTVGAEDALPIARARAKVDAAFKYAKAHNPAYADKSHVEVTHIDLGERLRRAQQRVHDARTIDGEVLRDTPAIAPPGDPSSSDGDGA